MSNARRKRREPGRRKPRDETPAPGPAISASRKTDTGSSPRTAALRPWAVCLVLAAIAVVVYWPVRNYPFTGWDDPGYVTDNPRVTAGLTLDGVRWALTSGYFANWHPLTWMSHMLDVQLFGLSAGAHHLVNLLLHVADTLLLFGVLARTTGAAGRSAVVAALFAVHPMHVESVAWVAERKDVLSTFFWMLTLWAYTAYVRRPDWRRYAVVALCFALGLMAKPMLVTLPCVLLLLDVWPLRRVVIGESARAAWVRLVLEKVALFALAAASSVITYVVQRTAGAMETLNRLPLSIRLANAILAYWSYIRKLVWPTRLALLYPYPRSIYIGTVALALVALIVISIGVARVAKSRPWLLVGWLWFLGTLVPVIGIVQVGKQPMADRYTYVPSIGLFVMVVWGAADLLERIREPRGLSPALATALVATLAVAARAQVDRWHSGVELWTHTLAVTDDNYLAENNLGWDLARENRAADAIPHYEHAIQISPGFTGAHTNLALALVAVGRNADAVAQYEEALRIEPKNYLILGSLGFALSNLNRPDDAISRFKQALELKPDYVEALNAMGLAFARKGNTDSAIVQYRAAIRYMPKFAEAHNNLGAALASQGKLEEAIGHFSEAIRQKPALADAHNNLGVALSSEGKVDSAIAQFREAVRLDSNHAKAHYGLGLALQRTGRPAEAAKEFNEVLRLRPTDADARRALGGLGPYPN